MTTICAVVCIWCCRCCCFVVVIARNVTVLKPRRGSKRSQRIKPCFRNVNKRYEILLRALAYDIIFLFVHTGYWQRSISSFVCDYKTCLFYCFGELKSYPYILVHSETLWIRFVSCIRYNWTFSIRRLSTAAKGLLRPWILTGYAADEPQYLVWW